MITRHLLSALLATAGLAACTPATPEQQFINDLRTALGGESRLQAVKTLAIEGEGVNYNLGQDMKPEASTQQFAISDYTRRIDIANSRQRVEQTRTPKFTFFQGPQPQKQIQGLDGEIAFNVNAKGEATRLGAQAEQDRRFDIYHHPLKLARATLDPATTVSNVRPGAVRQADIKTAAGPVVTVTLDAAGLPLSISSNTYHPNLGDVVVTTTLASYEDVNGLKLPTRLTTKVDTFTTAEIHATKQAIDADVGDLAAPASARAAAPAPAAPSVVPESIGKGVWLMGGQSHHSVLVEFSDHLMLIEAPQSEARTLAVIAKAKELVPGKPLTKLVTTHHHFDHTAGLRAAIAEGMDVITQAGNRDWVEAMARRPHTLRPDTLANKATRLVVTPVDAELEVKDQTMIVMLYHVAANPHSDTMLMAYIPRDRTIVEVDAFGAGSSFNPYAANLLENIQKRKLRVDRIAALHGNAPIAKMAELEKVGRP